MERYNCSVDEYGTLSYVNLTLEQVNDAALVNRGGLVNRRHASIVQGRLYSFLYYDKSSDLGKGERIIRGRVSAINAKLTRSSTRIANDYMDQDIAVRNTLINNLCPVVSDTKSKESGFTIVVDASVPGYSNIEKLNLEHIMDIRDICYNWNTDEHPKLIPNDPDFPVWEKGFNPQDEEYITSVSTHPRHISK